MAARTRARLAWGLFGLYVLLFALVFVLAALTGDWAEVFWSATVVTFALVGALVASRVGNAVGWICLGVGLAVAFGAACEEYAVYALLTNPGSVPGGAYAAWYSTFSWVTFIAPIGIFLILLFPDGRLPSSALWPGCRSLPASSTARRWRSRTPSASMPRVC